MSAALRGVRWKPVRVRHCVPDKSLPELPASASASAAAVAASASAAEVAATGPSPKALSSDRLLPRARRVERPLSYLKRLGQQPAPPKSKRSLFKGLAGLPPQPPLSSS